MRARFVSLVILLGSVSAFAQFTPPADVSTPVYGPAAGDQGSPVVATDGRDFLVAELDRRSYPPSIYANRLTADGHVLDGTGIRIATGECVIAGLHFIDGAYVVLYYTFGNSLAVQTAIVRINADGQLIDGPRVIVDQGAFASASNGSRIVLLTAHEFIAIDGRGNVTGRYPTFEPASAIASNGTTFLAAGFKQNGAFWNEGLTALDANGQPIATSEVDNISSLGSAPFIASDGSGYLVMYTSFLAASSTTQRVDDHAQIQASIDSAGGFPALQLVWTGTTYVGIAWTQDQTKTAVVAYDRYGVPFAPPKTLGAGRPGAVAWNGTEVLLTWTTGTSTPTGADVAGALTDAMGMPKVTIASIATTANAQRNVAIATSANEDLVAWAEPTGIYATRVTPAGVPLDGRGITVSAESMDSSGYLNTGFKNIRVINDGTTFVVAWGGNRTWSNDTDLGLLTGPLKVQRIAYSGDLVGGTFIVSPCSRTFDLAMGDSPVLFFTPCTGGGVVAQHLSSGVPVGAAVVVSNMSTADNPRAAWNGSVWLVVWNNLIESGLLIDPPEFQGEAYAARLSALLTPMDASPTIVDANEMHTAGAPLVATNGTDFLIAWDSARFGDISGLYGRTVHADGSISAEDRLVDGIADAESVVWDDRRYAIAYATKTSSYGANWDLFLTHAGSHEQLAISGTEDTVLDAPLVAAPGRPLRVVYTRLATESQFGGVPRAFVRDEILPKRRAIR